VTPVIERKNAAKASTAKHRWGQRRCNFFIFLALLEGVLYLEMATWYHSNALRQKT